MKKTMLTVSICLLTFMVVQAQILMPDALTTASGTIATDEVYLTYRVGTLPVILNSRTPQQYVVSKEQFEQIDPRSSDLSGENSVFPNPSKGHITLINSFSEEEVIQINLLDSYGKVLEKINYQDQISLDLSNYANGIYFIAIQTKDNIHQFSISKIH